VAAVSGGAQSATVGTSFASALQVKVTDGSSNPVANLPVTFAAPVSGASATFGALNSTTVNTNSSGIAVSPIPKANNTTGSYTVTASVTGIAPVTFNLTNTVVVPVTTNLFGTIAPTTAFAEGTPVEMGMKFRSDVNGTIVGVRFYKSNVENTTHTGSLWSRTGTLLATGTFTGETASGWQQLTFTTPVAITANTTYVVSYHSGGAYFATNNFFSTTGFDNGPLHGLKDGIDGANGLYSYGPGTVFPTQSYQAANYWVDVIFVAN
jgi:hypothetical protein